MGVGMIFLIIFLGLCATFLAVAAGFWVVELVRSIKMVKREEAIEKQYKETGKQLFPEMYAHANSHKNNRKKTACKDVNILKSKIVTKTKEKEKTLEM